ncbi:substrate-binding domain-containing protein [Phytohabitans sp. ZYX-F-186]|uniref:Substrate-binding domain-containing protein n=1 Tax=Phytohabitans maris TaxID=3071409 RepID=A0ABU0ZNA3_9ACTN|nr:VWA domain-containing protein [Phytohabitans sp. ZYX-F-186]MDQ7907854.1 substrate-binding domain-containing protein [Phytohabitans sp. ZYX-F-186]
MHSNFRGAGAIAVAVALVVVVGGSWFGYRELAGSRCTGEMKLALAASPEIAPAVRSTVESWRADGGSAGGTCVAVDINEVNSVDMAAVIAAQHNVGLAGVGSANGTLETPDVWLPDSSSWLVRLKNLAPGFNPTDGGSVARSPVVAAMPEPLAESLGWPEKKVGWTDLLKRITTGTGLRTGIVEPTRDAAGLSGLLSLGAAASGGNGAQAQTAALRSLAIGRSALRDDLVAKFPQASDAASLASGLNVAPLSEEDVIEYNAKKPPVPLAALYVEPTPAPLDYPFAVMPGVDPDKAAAAEAVHDALDTRSFRDLLGAQGLRAPDGTWGSGFSAPTGAPSPAGGPPSATPNAGGRAAGDLDPLALDRSLATWTAVTAPGRMLAVMDVSGSMLERVPTAENATRMAVTLAAAQGGLSLFDDSWALGLWTFSTELDGGKDWRELVPIGPLSSNRSQALNALKSISPKPDGDTGLYDTMLAAYKEVQDGWAADRVNSIVMFTDGKNDDANGINEQTLLAQLKDLADPRRPIQVIILGIGDGVDEGQLKRITNVTGGGVFVTKDPTKIGDIFLKALALRPAAPR